MLMFPRCLGPTIIIKFHLVKTSVQSNNISARKIEISLDQEKGRQLHKMKGVQSQSDLSSYR